MTIYLFGAHKVHQRRTTVTFENVAGGIESYVMVKPGEANRGRFEQEFGVPTDLDKVWKARADLHRVRLAFNDFSKEFS